MPSGKSANVSAPDGQIAAQWPQEMHPAGSTSRMGASFCRIDAVNGQTNTQIALAVLLAQLMIDHYFGGSLLFPQHISILDV
ncbi:MAG: hypothetical protein WCE81_05600 [Halobacteriota archaeon]